MAKNLLDTVAEADWSSYRKKLKDRAIGSRVRSTPKTIPKKEHEYGNRRALKWLNRKLGLPEIN